MQPAAIPEMVVSNTQLYASVINPTSKPPKLYFLWMNSPILLTACTLLWEEDETLKFGVPLLLLSFLKGEMLAKIQPPKLSTTELEKATVQVA